MALDCIAIKRNASGCGRDVPPLELGPKYCSARSFECFARTLLACSLLSGLNSRTVLPSLATELPAQQRWELGNRCHGRVDLEPQLLGNLGCAALNPKRPQSGRLCRATVPIVGGDKAEL